ncbi:MAG: hypothetical protein EPN86_01645 [Nanoarchaeota archaeon]|nr:MAG: hypothetical protein EPN86_01645 [Nanoarchaeota archaeon]
MVQLKRIGIIIAWIVGITFSVNGLMEMVKGVFIAGLFIFVGGLLTFPLVFSKIRDSQKKRFSEKTINITLGVLIAMFIVIGMSMNPTQLATQADSQNKVTSNEQSSSCPSQGFLQSNLQYCVQLCMLDKNEIGSICDQICRDMKSLDGSTGSEFLSSQVQDFKCSNCGDCTQEQLAKIEEQKKKIEEQQIEYNNTLKETQRKQECLANLTPAYKNCTSEQSRLDNRWESEHARCDNDCINSAKGSQCWCSNNFCNDDCKSSYNTCMTSCLKMDPPSMWSKNCSIIIAPCETTSINP